MWAFFIEDRTLFYPAVDVATPQQSGHSETIFSKAVAYHSSSVHPQKSWYVTLKRGLAVCGSVGTGLCTAITKFHPLLRTSPRLPRTLFPSLPQSLSLPLSLPPSLSQSLSLSVSLSLSLSLSLFFFFFFSYSTEIMWTQELATPSFSLLLRWSILTCTGTTTVFENPNGFLQNKHLIYLLFWPPVLRDMYFWCKA